MTGSFQNGRTSSKMWGPAFNIVSLPKIACKIVRPFKPDFRERWQVSEFLVSSRKTRSGREFSFSSWCLRVKIINLDLVSMPEIGGNFFSVSSRSLRVSVRNSRSRLDERDWIGETLILVSRLKKRLSLTTGTKSSTKSAVCATNQANVQARWSVIWWFILVTKILLASSATTLVHTRASSSKTFRQKAV